MTILILCWIAPDTTLTRTHQCLDWVIHVDPLPSANKSLQDNRNNTRQQSLRPAPCHDHPLSKELEGSGGWASRRGAGLPPRMRSIHCRRADGFPRRGCLRYTQQHHPLSNREPSPMEDPAILRREINTLVFDQYGTIVDMQSGLVAAVTPFLKEKGWDGKPNSFVTWWRRTHYENSMIDALCDRGHTPYRQIGHRAVSHVMDRCGFSYSQDEVRWLVSEIEKLKPFEDVLNALHDLRAAGLKLVILSNGDRDMLEAAKPHIGFPFRRCDLGTGGGLFQAALENLCDRAGAHRRGALQHPVRCQSRVRLHRRQEFRHAHRLY